MPTGIVLLGTWLMSLVVPLAKKVLLGLGIGWITYAGVSASLAVVEGHVLSYWGGMPSDVLALLGLWGMTDAVGIILGGMAMRVTIAVTDQLGKVVTQ